MTEEELNRLEARAKMSLHVDSRDVLALIALARAGLAIANAEETIERIASAMFEHQFSPTGCPPSWEKLINADTKQIFREKAKAALSALPKPGVADDKWLAAIDAAGDVEVGAGIMAADPVAKPGE